MISNTGKLAGKTLFITGASRGIGKAIALKAAKDGANIIVAAKTATAHPKLPGTIYTAAEEIEKAGGKALPCVVDIRNEEQVKDAVNQAVAKFGGIDILINNASAISLTPTEKTDMKRYDLMHSINTRGTFLVSKECLPHLLKSNHAHILNISPPLNLDPSWFADHVAYTMAKYGMSMCVLGMAAEYKTANVAVNALWPRTAIQTAAMDMLSEGTASSICRKPDIMADAAYVVLSKKPNEVTGKFLIDDEVLTEAGVSDIKQYACDPANADNLLIDFFLGSKDRGELSTLRKILAFFSVEDVLQHNIDDISRLVKNNEFTSKTKTYMNTLFKLNSYLKFPFASKNQNSNTDKNEPSVLNMSSSFLIKPCNIKSTSRVNKMIEGSHRARPRRNDSSNILSSKNSERPNILATLTSAESNISVTLNENKKQLNDIVSKSESFSFNKMGLYSIYNNKMIFALHSENNQLYVNYSTQQVQECFCEKYYYSDTVANNKTAKVQLEDVNKINLNKKPMLELNTEKSTSTDNLKPELSKKVKKIIDKDVPNKDIDKTSNTTNTVAPNRKEIKEIASGREILTAEKNSLRFVENQEESFDKDNMQRDYYKYKELLFTNYIKEIDAVKHNEDKKKVNELFNTIINKETFLKYNPENEKSDDINTSDVTELDNSVPKISSNQSKPVSNNEDSSKNGVKFIDLSNVVSRKTDSLKAGAQSNNADSIPSSNPSNLKTNKNIYSKTETNMNTITGKYTDPSTVIISKENSSKDDRELNNIDSSKASKSIENTEYDASVAADLSMVSAIDLQMKNSLFIKPAESKYMLQSVGENEIEYFIPNAKNPLPETVKKNSDLLLTNYVNQSSINENSAAQTVSSQLLTTKIYKDTSKAVIKDSASGKETSNVNTEKRIGLDSDIKLAEPINKLASVTKEFDETSSKLILRNVNQTDRSLKSNESKMNTLNIDVFTKELQPTEVMITYYPSDVETNNNLENTTCIDTEKERNKLCNTNDSVKSLKLDLSKLDTERDEKGVMQKILKQSFGEVKEKIKQPVKMNVNILEENPKALSTNSFDFRIDKPVCEKSTTLSVNNQEVVNQKEYQKISKNKIKICKMPNETSYKIGEAVISVNFKLKQYDNSSSNVIFNNNTLYPHDKLKPHLNTAPSKLAEVKSNLKPNLKAQGKPYSTGTLPPPSPSSIYKTPLTSNIEIQAELGKQDTKSGEDVYTGKIGGLFKQIRTTLSPEIVEKTKALYQFDVTGSEKGTWYLDLKEGPGSVGKGAPKERPDAILTMDTDNFLKMFGGQLKPAVAYMMGKLKISGDLQKAMKLEKLMTKLKSKL